MFQCDQCEKFCDNVPEDFYCDDCQWLSDFQVQHFHGFRKEIEETFGELYPSFKSSIIKVSFKNHDPYTFLFIGAEDWHNYEGLHPTICNKIVEQNKFEEDDEITFI